MAVAFEVAPLILLLVNTDSVKLAYSTRISASTDGAVVNSNILSSFFTTKSVYCLESLILIII